MAYRTDPSIGIKSVLKVENITLSNGRIDIVKNVSFEIREGTITLLAGPNGAGKSTILSIICGLLQQSSGEATLYGRPYRNIVDPIFCVGAFLSSEWLDPGRSARYNLEILAQSAGIDKSRIDEVIELCGLQAAEDRRVKGFSLGMRQRCGIAAALLGDPKLLILDEPANGLDPLGMKWMRELLCQHRDNGGTVLLSSHLLRDAEDICDDLVVLAHGEVQWAGPLNQFGGGMEISTEFISNKSKDIIDVLGISLEHVSRISDKLLCVPVEPEAVSAAARQCGADLSYLVPKKGSLEESFQALVSGKEDIR